MSTESPKHIIVVASLVRNAQERILLVRHHKRGWETPQGRVEEGESLMSALAREVLEESGVEIEPGPLACVWSKLTPPSAHIFTFISRYRRGDLIPCGECPEVGWFTAAEALARIPHPANRDRLRTLLDFEGTTLFRAYTTHPYHVLHTPE